MSILIVDDSDDTRITTKAILESTGFTDVHSVRSAREAYLFLGLGKPDDDTPAVDVILMDIMMPHIDGLEACRHIKSHERLRDIPIIVVTARTEEKDLEAAFAAGAADYLTKPVKVPELLARLRSALALKHELDRRQAYQRELLEVTRELREVNRLLEDLSVQDPLTGLANRRSFDAALRREWSRALREASPLSVVMMDIDHFKSFNDYYGHLRGDDCLRQVAGALGGGLKRPGDLLARYGGEEFVAVLARTGAGGAAAVAETFRGSVESLGLENEHAPRRRVTLSLGVSTTIPDRHMTPEALVGAADRALYGAKQSGRNRVVVFHSWPEQLERPDRVGSHAESSVGSRQTGEF